VRNRGATTAEHFLVTFNVKPWAGIEFRYPGDFLPCVAAVAGFDLAPGASTVVKARWPAAQVPPAGTHACLLASVIARSDHPGTELHVWQHNNLAQKNLTVVDLRPDDWLVLPFVVARPPQLRARLFLLELSRPEGWDHLQAALLHRSGAGLGLVPRSVVRPATLSAPRARGAPEFQPLDCGGGPSPSPRSPPRSTRPPARSRPCSIAPWPTSPVASGAPAATTPMPRLRYGPRLGLDHHPTAPRTPIALRKSRPPTAPERKVFSGAGVSKLQHP
jgi:hypothetical protein